MKNLIINIYQMIMAYNMIVLQGCKEEEALATLMDG